MRMQHWLGSTKLLSLATCAALSLWCSAVVGCDDTRPGAAGPVAESSRSSEQAVPDKGVPSGACGGGSEDDAGLDGGDAFDPPRSDVTCALWYREDLSVPGFQEIGAELDIGGTQTFAFPLLEVTLTLEELEPDRASLLVVSAPGSHQELPFMHGERMFPAPRPTRPTGGSGLIYVRAPDSPAEVQLQCFGADRVSKNLSLSGGPGVECEVVERSSKGGAIERSEQLRFDATAQKELVLRGATVWGSFFNEPLEGGFFAITAGWGPNGQDHGVRHLVQFGSSGKPSPVPNRLLETMTGTVSVLTPLGTEVSYGCVAK